MSNSANPPMPAGAFKPECHFGHNGLYLTLPYGFRRT